MSAAPIFSKFRQELTRDKVYAAIKEAILAGRLKTGDKITELVLAGEFQVSRAVIREALQQLGHEGLVEQNSYKGTRVVQLSAQQVDECLSVRLLLETEAVRQARQRLTETDRKELRSLARRLEATGSAQSYAEQDLALHERLWELSGNQTLQKLLRQVTSPLFAMGTILRYSVGHSGNQVKAGGKAQANARPSNHIQLIEAICAGTDEEVVQAIRKHLTRNWKTTRRNVEELLGTAPAPEPAKRNRKKV